MEKKFKYIVLLICIISCTFDRSNMKKSETGNMPSEDIKIRHFIDSMNIKWDWCIQMDTIKKNRKGQKVQSYKIDLIDVLNSLKSNIYLVSSTCADGGNFFVLYSVKKNNIHVIPISNSEIYFFEKPSNESIDLYKTLFECKNDDFEELEYFINSLDSINEEILPYDMKSFFTYYISEKFKMERSRVDKMINEKFYEKIDSTHSDQLRELLFDIFHPRKESKDVYHCVYYDSGRTHVFFVRKIQVMKFISSYKYKIYYYIF